MFRKLNAITKAVIAVEATALIITLVLILLGRPVPYFVVGLFFGGMAAAFVSVLIQKRKER